jgi:hypothetical protein
MVILGLIHAKTPAKVAIVDGSEPIGVYSVIGDYGESADRLIRQFVPASDLSASVGKVLAYRGCDG